MQFTLIFGAIIFALSFSMSLLALLGAIFKCVGATYFGIAPILFFLFFPCLCLAAELNICFYAPYVWGVSYIFIVFNLGFVALQYVFAVGSAVFTKKRIYRFTIFLVFKSYEYSAVIGYTMKKSSGIVVRRYGQTKVVTYDVEIYLEDGKRVMFSTRDESDKKISYIKALLESHNCRKNGRIMWSPQ